MEDFLAFRKMITPVLIQILFWLGSVAVVFTGILVIFTGAISPANQGQVILGGLLVIVGGPLVIRIYCELLILFFRMNETLSEIKRSIDRRVE